MTFSERVRLLFARKDSQARTLIAQVQTGAYVPMPKDYKGFSEEGYKKNVVAYRSVASVARASAGIQWVLYKKGTGPRSKQRQEIHAHPLLALLKRPNPIMGQSTFMEAVLSFKLISGNSYIEAVGTKRDSLQNVKELWPLRPDRMVIVPGARGYAAAFVYKINQQERRFIVDQVNLKSPVLHWKFFNPTDDWYGMSPVEAAAMGIDQHNSSNKWNNALLQNSARPSGALVVSVSDRSTGVLTDEQFRRLKEQVEDNYTGSHNAGRPMVLEGGLDWKPFSFSPQQMEWIENKNTSARDISLAFGVPPQMLGIPGDNTYSNYQEARAALYEETVIPEHDSLRDELNNWITPVFGEGIELDSDKDSIHALAPRRQAVWDKISSASFLTVNEKREATGYEPVEGGDAILVNSTQLPLEDAIEGASAAEVPGQNPAGVAPADAPEESQDPEESEDSEDQQPAKAAPRFEAKIFNLSDRAKQKEVRSQVRMKKAAERKLMRQAQAILEIEGHRVAEVCKGIDPSHAMVAARREIDANAAQWKTVLKANLETTAKAFGSRVFDSLKSMGEPAERKDAQSKFDSYIKTWIEHHVGERITHITETTKEKVLKAIRDAQEENYDSGEPLGDLSEKVQAAYEEFSPSRAMLIARTETGTTANMALVQAAKSTGLPGLQKEWNWTNDERTRDDHKIERSVVPIDEEFDVGGFSMSQPGDPKGPPEEICNCRCCLTFSRDQGDGE